MKYIVYDPKPTEPGGTPYVVAAKDDNQKHGHKYVVASFQDGEKANAFATLCNKLQPDFDLYATDDKVVHISGVHNLMIATVHLVIPVEDTSEGYMADTVSAILRERLEGDGTILDWGYVIKEGVYVDNKDLGLIDTGEYEEGQFYSALKNIQ